MKFISLIINNRLESTYEPEFNNALSNSNMLKMHLKKKKEKDYTKEMCKVMNKNNESNKNNY